MQIEPSDAAAIEASLEIAAERAGDLTPTVYARLFAREPAMQALFWRDSDGAVRGEMLMRAFEALFDFIGERHYAHRMIQSEVITHEGYDVPREVFGTFFYIVAEVVREACAAQWTGAMDQGWARVLAELDYFVTHTDQMPA